MSICGIILCIIFFEEIIALAILALVAIFYIGLVIIAVAIPALIIVNVVSVSPVTATIISVVGWLFLIGLSHEDESTNKNQVVEA